MKFSRRDLEWHRAAGTGPGLLAHIPIVAAFSARAFQSERHQVELGHKVIGKSNDHSFGPVHDDVDRFVAFIHTVSMPSSRPTPTKREISP